VLPQNWILQLIVMSEASLVAAGVHVGVSGDSATAARLHSGADGNITVPSSVFFPRLSATLRLTRIGGHAFKRALIISITIPRHVQIVCSFCFSSCNSLSSISFETDSELTRIQSSAFFSCYSLESITIPRHVQILCSSCFSSCNSLSSISFEIDSELTRIESCAFYSCSSLKSITIPRHVQILCSECFSSWNSLSSISFEIDSELMRIETRAFTGTRLALVLVPGSTSFIAGDAFPHDCSVTLAGADCDADLSEWTLRRRFGWSEAFERKP
jgi:hypothetical protein